MVSAEQKFNACLQLAHFHASRFDARRGFEWKMTLGYWTAILLAINKVWGSDVSIPSIAIVASGFSYLAVWLRGIFKNHSIDRDHMLHYLRAAQEICLDSQYQVQRPPDVIRPNSWKWWLGFLCNYGGIFQTITTVLLLYVLWVSPKAR